MTLVVLNDITFMGKSTNPPVVDLDAQHRRHADGRRRLRRARPTPAAPAPFRGPETGSKRTPPPAAARRPGQVRVIDTPTAGTDLRPSPEQQRNRRGSSPARRGSIDLSGYVTSTMTYSYVTSAGLTAADSVAVEVSSNGGTNWTLLKTYTGSSASATTYDHRFGEPLGLRIDEYAWSVSGYRERPPTPARPNTSMSTTSRSRACRPAPPMPTRKATPPAS